MLRHVAECGGRAVVEDENLNEEGGTAAGLSENENDETHNRRVRLIPAVSKQEDSCKVTLSLADVSKLQQRVSELERRVEDVNVELMEKVEGWNSETTSNLLENIQLVKKNRMELDEVNQLMKDLTQDAHKLASYDATFKALTEKISKVEKDTADILKRLETVKCIRLAEIEDQKTLLKQLQKTSHDGHLIWKISGIQTHREEALTRRSIYSHPFYTQIYGYKMCVRIYLNGDGEGEGTHISLLFTVVKGDYDPLLEWPFKQHVTIKLRNVAGTEPDIIKEFQPDPNPASCDRPPMESDMYTAMCPQFAEQDYVFNPANGFMEDDTMYIDIVVDNSHTSLADLPNIPINAEAELCTQPPQ